MAVISDDGDSEKESLGDTEVDSDGDGVVVRVLPNDSVHSDLEAEMDNWSL